ncbi:MAG: Grx4 family monothiol glutaredoxin [Rhodobacteraceae bacterium]|nr:Grx4 family monothiol glutaredoxin [Paracoccaceae bacterium]MCY4196918.1 Grx4 family monothiol glutaredoxin [Paracoccaceae bacterium]
MSEDIQNEIQQLVKDNDVVLFMKGNRGVPQCGFSSRVVSVLNYLEVTYSDVNVLENPRIREGVKQFSEWPTIPQLYVKGEFIGGCDIITEMTLSGELETLFDNHSITYSKEASTRLREHNS